MGTWEQALASWRAHMTTAGLTPETIKLRGYHLGRVAAAVGQTPGTVTHEQLADWLAGQDWAPNTRRSYRASLRAFYAWAVLAGLVEASPAQQLPRVKVPRAQPRPTPEADYRFILRAADPRVRLAVRLAGQHGLRRGEIARARREDLEADLVGWCLRVVGKGGHVRLVPLDEDTAAAIQAAPPGWLFPSPRRPGEHLTPHHLGKLISRWLPGDLTTHTLRHRCGTVAYAATRDLRAVQELLGHAKPETTAIYTAVDRTAIRAAVHGAA